MNSRRLLLCLVFLLALATPALRAAEGFKTATINIGYLPQNDFGARVAVADLADYFKKLEAICTETFAHTATPEDLDVVVLVKPVQGAKIWFISSRAAAPGEEREALRKKLEAVPAPKVSAGPIAFAIEAKIAGGVPGTRADSSKPPIPREWDEILSKQTGPLDFDAIVPLVWPAPSPLLAASAPSAKTPAEFVTQVLEPTGGKIPRPKDWFYRENHSATGYLWTLSREDTSGNRPYVTGFRIQAFADVKKNTGKSAREFALDFFTQKKKEAAKVVKIFEEQNQGLFSRVGIETEEGQNHIIYSLFWGNKDLDLAIFTIAGTTKDLWNTYAPAFDRMNQFELIDMKRFQQPGRVKVPAGVTYKEASAEKNDQAKRLLQEKFTAKASDADILALFQDKLICGPGLWREIKSAPAMAALKKGNANFIADGQKLEGKLFQSPDEVLAFWKVFRQRIDLNNLTIRKLNEEELRVFWALISFDIEEPVYIIETPKAKILVDFIDNKPLKIFWIDDLQNAQLK